MFILDSIETMKRAIDRAKTIHPKVRAVCFGRYEVSGSAGGFYTVVCKRDRRGLKIVDCTCKAGQSGKACFHAAVAIPMHMHLAQNNAP